MMLQITSPKRRTKQILKIQPSVLLAKNVSFISLTLTLPFFFSGGFYVDAFLHRGLLENREV